MTAPARALRTTRGTLALGGRPWLMGIVNASADSFSDGGGARTLGDRVALARELLDVGADVIDIGGESGVTNRPAVGPSEEIERVAPLIERVAGELEALRELHRLHELGRPLLLAVSRKDFVGAITARPPRRRLAGTLAAIGFGVDAGAHVLRVHDVAAAAEYLAVRAALRGEREVDPGLRLADELRWEQGS